MARTFLRLPLEEDYYHVRCRERQMLHTMIIKKEFELLWGGRLNGISKPEGYSQD